MGKRDSPNFETSPKAQEVFYEEESRFDRLLQCPAGNGKTGEIAKTPQVGHLPDSHGLVIGSRLVLGG